MPDYGPKHRAERAKWEPRVMAGKVKCWRCHRKIDPVADALELGITPGETWDLGHDDDDAAIYRGPEHARRTAKHPACNRATTGRRVARARRPQGKHPGLR
jgi:hypothetical protein